MQRREFLKFGGAGIVASAALGGLAPVKAATREIALSINTTRVLLIDGKYVNMLSFSGNNIQNRVPGPVLRVTEGDQVSMTVSNWRPESHGFEIGGISGSKMTIPGAVGAQPGVATKTFTAPEAGTYMYFDGSHKSEHLYRVVGLHGALVVHPRSGLSVNNPALATITPYSMDRYSGDAPKRVSMVFEAFGNTPRFPVGKWDPCPLDREFATQERIWIFNEIDPKFNAMITPTGIAAIAPTTPEAMRLTYVPRYFTINGRSGYDLQNAYDVTIKNFIGEPTLVRTLNVGLAHHATHIHGNHMFELAHTILTEDGFLPIAGGVENKGKVILHNSVWERDTWPTWPMQIRDMLLPLEVPPDIPNWHKFQNGTAQEPFPLRYVMHDHCEMGTTAAGGNYPQGAVLHWQITGLAGGRGRSTV